MTTSAKHSPSSNARQLWTAMREDLTDRTRARAAHSALKRELASYSRPAEITDLLEALRGQNGPEVDEIRGILVRNMYRAAVA